MNPHPPSCAYAIASARVRTHHQQIGFDGPAMFAALGIEAALGNYRETSAEGGA